MTNTTADTRPDLPPLVVAETDPERALAGIKRQFPGVVAYFGEFTRSWWAMVDEKLLEAKDPGELAELIRAGLRASGARRTAPMAALAPPGHFAGRGGLPFIRPAGGQAGRHLPVPLSPQRLPVPLHPQRLPVPLPPRQPPRAQRRRRRRRTAGLLSRLLRRRAAIRRRATRW